ncbi:MAG: hypothetical protein ACO1NO_12725, partial [Burkholderiaceae bacterium]
VNAVYELFRLGFMPMRGRKDGNQDGALRIPRPNAWSNDATIRSTCFVRRMMRLFSLCSLTYISYLYLP